MDLHKRWILSQIDLVDVFPIAAVAVVPSGMPSKSSKFVRMLDLESVRIAEARADLNARGPPLTLALWQACHL